MKKLAFRPKWNDVFVKKPVVAVVASSILLLAGMFAALRLPVIQFPVIESSSISIITYYPGASAETVKGFVTEPIERASNSIPGLDYVESITTSNRSEVTLWLQLNQNTTDALAELSTRLSQIRFELPEGAEDPAIQISRADSPYASFYLALPIPSNRTYIEISDIVQREILPRLSSVSRVQRTEYWGIPQAMRIWLDPWKMAALNVDASDVQTTLYRNNVISTLGNTQNRSQRIDLRADSEARVPKDFADMKILNEENTDIRLGDIAEIEVGTMDMSRMSRFNHDQTVFIGLYPEPGASEIMVADALYKEVKALNETLPTDLELIIPWDNSRYMRSALSEIFLTLSETILLVGFVVVALMGSLRTALVPLLTIPISILGATAAIWLMGFSMNLLTILAIVLSVGLVVDDAIVVVENVAKNLREGMSKTDAALASSRRLLSPIIAMTLTLAVVYAPIGFLSGFSGFLFREFAFTLAIAVVISGFVAITLSPIMSAWVCPSKGLENRASRWVNGRFEKTANSYLKIVNFSLAWRWQLAVGGLFFTVLSAPLYLLSQKELAPTEDSSAVSLVVEAAPESSLEETLEGFVSTTDTLMVTPGATTFWQAITTSGGFGGQEFVPPNQRELSVTEMLPDLQRLVSELPAINAFLIPEQALPTAGQFDLEIVITSSDEAAAMLPHAELMVRESLKSGLFMYFETGLKIDLPKVNFILDKRRVADLGMSLEDLTAQVGLLLSETYVTRYDSRGRAYRVIPMLPEKLRSSPEKLLDLPVKTPLGDMVPFGSFVTLERITSPRSLTRHQQKNSFKLYGGIMPGTTKEQALRHVEGVAAKVLPANYVVDYTGESREIRREGNTLIGVLAIAIVLVFFVLSVQFNSFRDPLIIILGSAPLALFSALVITFTGFTTVNIYSQIGLITLVGLVSKNAILIVEFANREQRSGLDKLSAIKAASVGRLRPVLMTTGATVLGHLPLVLVSGAGAEARNSIGFILVFGMLIGSLFTLIVLPAIYAILASEHNEVDTGSSMEVNYSRDGATLTS